MVQLILNFWLMLNRVSPFCTVYVVNWMALSCVCDFISLAPSTSGLPVPAEGWVFTIKLTALKVSPKANTRQIIAAVFKI